MTHLIRFCCTLAALTLGAALYTNTVVPSAAYAAPTVATPTPTPTPTVIIVNSLSDAAANDGMCTLREAITSANTNTASGTASGECAAGGALDSINLSVTGTIILTSALPDLTTALTLNGPGARLLTVSGNNANRVFIVTGTAMVYMSGLTVSGGKAAGSAGLYVYSNGSLTMNECSVSDNHATGSGGGISNCGTLRINNSTISNNSASDYGGGLMTGGCGIGSAVLTNTTVSSNSAYMGGGITNLNVFTMRNTTVTANSATSGGGIYNPGIGSLNFGDTIVAGNSAASSSPDCSGANFNSDDYNLVGNTSGCNIGGATTHNITGVSADLGPLADNGGPTQTHRPAYTSPAVDKGKFFGPVTDQRGLARPLNFTEVADAAGGDGSDIGAVELQGDDQPASGQQPFVVNSTADTDDGSCDAAGAGTGNHDCTLREALNAANALAGADTVNFDPTVFAAPGLYTIELTAMLPPISTSVTVNGPGADVLTLRRSTAGFYRLLHITAIPVRLSGMTLTNGRAPNGAGAGGALFNFGVTTLTGVRITGNRSGDGAVGSPSGGSGGGIYNSGTLTLVNCLVAGNTTGNGVIDSSQNGDGGGGGGVYSSGVLTLTNCLVNGNSTGTGPNAGGSGGGVYASDKATLTNTTVSNNTTGAGGFSSSRGGGLYANGLTLTLTNSTITGNSSQFGVDHGVAVGPAQASISVGNTIVARNGAGAQSDLTGLPNWYTSRGHNIIGIVSNSGGGNVFINGQNGDRVGTPASPVNPLLAALGDYGGPTQTFALLPGSPAIDAGSSTGAPATDQRGISRVGAVDIGAFESRGFSVAATAGPPQSATIFTAFGTPLSATITSAFGEPTSGGLVTFNAPASGATGTFAASATVSINSGGVASAPTFTANGMAGTYGVTASANSYSATFALTNLKGDQTISFGDLPNRTFGDAPFSVSATGGASTNPLTFSSQTPATCSVSGGTVTLLGAGSCTVRASQAADSNYNAAPNVDRPFLIAKAGSATTVSSSANPSASGQSVTFTASVTSAAGAPTGSVLFKADGSDLGAAPLNNGGVATLTTSVLAVGTHNVAAEYGGDLNFAASSGALAGTQAVGSVVEFVQSSYEAAEGAGSLSVNVVRTGDTSGASDVDYTTDDGSNPAVSVPCSAVTGLALDRCDFTRGLGALHFAAGETEKSLTVLVSDDSYAEGTETLMLRLSNPSAGTLLGARTAATLNITDDVPESSANPIDSDEAFVRQHYRDFLNREADAPGLAFWVGGVTSCGADAGCREVKRIDTSAAFFLSIEFQETGFLAYRTFKAAYGDTTSPNVEGTVPVVRLSEFLTDTQRIGAGIIVNSPGWEQKLADNKQAYALEFVQRPRFTKVFPLTMTAEELVTKLDQNAGGVVSAVEKAQLVSALGSMPGDASRRAVALMQVAENATLRQRETGRAFVLMQFYGYLRRDPDAAPDADFRGWKFWLDKLDSFGGDYRRAEMVKAFISSDEYRKRFGQ